MKMFSMRFIRRVMAGATTDLQGIHGLDHWQRVWRNGQRLAGGQDGYVLDILALFALFHDTQRLNDDGDPKHGRRAAEYLDHLYRAALNGDPDLSELADFPVYLIRAVGYACEIHTACQPGDNEEEKIDDPTFLPLPYKLCVKLCLDSDRLDIWRVGVPVDADQLFTEEARRIVKEEYIRGCPEDCQDQLQNRFADPIPHIAAMSRDQRDAVRRLYRECADGCMAELDLLLRAKPADSASGVVGITWCGSSVVIDQIGNLVVHHANGASKVHWLEEQAKIRHYPRHHRPLYHYTTDRGLVAILGSGEIRPSNFPALRLHRWQLNEHPYSGVWCSFARQMERALPSAPALDICPTDFEAMEEYAESYGLFRIEVNPNCAPITFGEHGDIELCEWLTLDVYRFGACADEWRLSKDPIPMREFLCIEEWSPATGWQAIERTQNPRVRAMWPLLPAWMRGDPVENDFMDPDHRHSDRRLRGAQVQRYVDRFDAARYDLWFLLARGDFSGAFILASAHREMCANLGGLPPVDQAACTGDLALWQWITGCPERAEALTWDAARLLYPGARLDQVVQAMQQQGIGQYFATLVRESASVYQLRGAEITTPVALFLALGHRAGRLTEQVDQLCHALMDQLSKIPLAPLMASALSQWMGSRDAVSLKATETRWDTSMDVVLPIGLGEPKQVPAPAATADNLH